MIGGQIAATHSIKIEDNCHLRLLKIVTDLGNSIDNIRIHYKTQFCFAFPTLRAHGCSKCEPQGRVPEKEGKEKKTTHKIMTTFTSGLYGIAKKRYYYQGTSARLFLGG